MDEYKKLTISRIQEEVRGVKTFVFEGDEAKEFSYRSGQYLTLVLPTQFGEIRRSYSITSSPVLNEALSIGVKRIENGVFSRYLIDEVTAGDQLYAAGTGGLFTLPDDLSPFRQLFFFAAGSGITPIYSLIKTVLFGHPDLSVVLIYSNRSEQSTIFYAALRQLTAKFPDRFRIEFLFSTSGNLLRARLYKDLLKQLFRQYATVPASQILSYVCGPENYMRMCTYGLRQLEVPAEHIKRENFSAMRYVPAVTPPDTQVHSVRVRLPHREYRFRAGYPDTILRAARKEGINLPYSCEGGRCGNCVARCREGKVWMAYNEVLTDRDIDQGLILTCVGYPVGGGVTLEIQ
jgi:ferredoxin-NADP reductase